MKNFFAATESHEDTVSNENLEMLTSPQKPHAPEQHSQLRSENDTILIASSSGCATPAIAGKNSDSDYAENIGSEELCMECVDEADVIKTDASYTPSCINPKRTPKVDLPVPDLHVNVNKSEQPEVRTLYMFQKSSTNDWVNFIHKYIEDVEFYQCSECPFRAALPNKVTTHLQDCHAGVKDIELKRPVFFLFCRHCDFIAYEKLSMWRHLEKYHGLTDVISPNPAGPPSLDNTQLVGLPLGALQTESVVFRCDACDLITLSRQDVMWHILRDHSRDNCVGEGFVQVSRLDARSKDRDGSRLPRIWSTSDNFVCLHCHHVTHDRSSIESHCIDRHANYLMLSVCSVCEEQFDKHDQMTRHFSLTHSDVNQHSCSVTLVGSDGNEVKQLYEPAELGDADSSGAAHSWDFDLSEAALSPKETTVLSSDDESPPRPSEQPQNIYPVYLVKSKPVAVVAGSSAVQKGPPVELPSAVHKAFPVALSSAVHKAFPVALSSAVHKAFPVALSSAVHKAFPVAFPSAVHKAFSVALPSAVQTAFPVQLPSAVQTAFPVQLPSAVQKALPLELQSALQTSLPVQLPSAVQKALPVQLPSAVQNAPPVELPLNSVTQNNWQTAESEPVTENDLPCESAHKVRYVQMPDGSIQLEMEWYVDCYE